MLDDDALGAIAAAIDRAIVDRAWPEWMNVETAARYLDVSPERVRKLQARGELPFYQEAPGCRVAFNRRELDEAIRRWRAPNYLAWLSHGLESRSTMRIRARP